MFPFLICLEFVWINSSPTVAGLIAPCASALPWACPWILRWPVSPCAGGVRFRAALGLSLDLALASLSVRWRCLR